MKRKIGEIEIGEYAFLSDPCYGKYSAHNSTIGTIKGVYNVFITRCESIDDFYKGRISNIYVIHKDYYKKDKTQPNDDKENLHCFVDSGTCGIFDAEYFEKFHTDDDVDDDWYEKFVINMDDYIITEGKGAISSSGIGDGCYKVYAKYDKGNAYAIRIKFL